MTSPTRERTTSCTFFSYLLEPDPLDPLDPPLVPEGPIEPLDPLDPPLVPEDPIDPLALLPPVPLDPEVSPRRSQPAAVRLNAATTRRIFDVVLSDCILDPFMKMNKVSVLDRFNSDKFARAAPHAAAINTVTACE